MKHEYYVALFTTGLDIAFKNKYFTLLTSAEFMSKYPNRRFFFIGTRETSGMGCPVIESGIQIFGFEKIKYKYLDGAVFADRGQ